MNDFLRAIENRLLVSYSDDSWLLNVFIIKANPNEHTSDELADEIIAKHLKLLEENCMVNGIRYVKTGFALLHFGNRGVNLSIWHIGAWGNTFEIFCCSWYTYKRDFEKMEVLPNSEPVMCSYEIPVIQKSLDDILNVFTSIEAIEFFREGFMKKYS